MSIDPPDSKKLSFVSDPLDCGCEDEANENKYKISDFWAKLLANFYLS